jgi:hypothetical protein
MGRKGAIPALNEEENRAKVLAAIPRDCVDEVLVVDGGNLFRLHCFLVVMRIADKKGGYQD